MHFGSVTSGPEVRQKGMEDQGHSFASWQPECRERQEKTLGLKYSLGTRL